MSDQETGAGAHRGDARPRAGRDRCRGEGPPGRALPDLPRAPVRAGPGGGRGAHPLGRDLGAGAGARVPPRPRCARLSPPARFPPPRAGPRARSLADQPLGRPARDRDRPRRARVRHPRQCELQGSVERPPLPHPLRPRGAPWVAPGARRPLPGHPGRRARLLLRGPRLRGGGAAAPRDRRALSVSPPGLRRAAALRARRGARAAPRRDGHGQGALRPGLRGRERAAGARLGAGPHPRPRPDPGRVRALRPRAGRLHRGDPRQEGPARDGRPGRPLPRRDRRRRARPADEAAPLPGLGGALPGG